ncbi:metal ABC transporter permease [Mameliella sediminis]|uniref:metal ABC transporter permease n=1 Tax=Mameliella sediminis TaxID=2836866 RepID=UPI001C44E45E|nr:metal ABC transporter permease [Mameliella sediminis]MBY6116523.1 metal ABC transporter permease [Antarctobacter heliothermus]MBY6146276.1 metal ABC transporter permease [Mameliella alba]MBV7396615.1 metal ABC transporter permease [Mameliella sediminis]MBY6162905.1 metal ABC transporter permease [Mameliella alba]MBY6171169.1 metal ABC transporter permease [Mameliella alba]
MLDDFLVRAALAAVGAALASAPLGVFVVWRRMAYFGDATSHAAILGVALALALSVPVFAGTLAVALVVAFGVARLSGRGFGADMVLGVAAHGALALGLVAASLLNGPRLNLEAYLFGDILAVSRMDLLVIWLGGAAVAALIGWRWQALLTSTISPDLAAASGLNPERERVILMLALALVVAVALKVVGALLIGALLVIPAAAARPLSSTPEQMLAGTATVGVVSALGGLWAAWTFDTPAGPSIVCASAALFALSSIFGRVTGARSV